MRRQFLRTSSSPQAPAIVETPAHYAPTLFCRLAPLSEVVIGSVEPTMSCISYENTMQKYTKYFILLLSKCKKHKKCDIFSHFLVFHFLRMRNWGCIHYDSF